MGAPEGAAVGYVALRKESVDRNRQLYEANSCE